MSSPRNTGRKGPRLELTHAPWSFSHSLKDSYLDRVVLQLFSQLVLRVNTQLREKMERLILALKKYLIIVFSYCTCDSGSAFLFCFLSL